MHIRIHIYQFGKQSTQTVFLLIAMISLSIFTSPAFSSGFFNVTNYGATGNGNTKDTQAIQAAVETAYKTGGGSVYFPAGTYLSGTIYLKDHVRLNLGMGAVLLGSTSIDDYPLNQCNFPSYSDRYVGRALIWGEGLRDVAISGKGTINGQGVHFKDNIPMQEEWEKLVSFYKDSSRYVPEKRYINRPYIIRLISCQDVLVENVTLLNSPMWMQQYLNCDFVTIQNIKVFNHGSKNNDMIDIDCCRNVVISGCFGDSDDDGLTLKSTGALPTENVTISNCILSSFCNAIKMGTESSGGFKNIAISNCVIRPSIEPNVIYGRKEGLAGIALEIVDGGTLDQITISNITIQGTTAPIFMRLGNRGRTFMPDMVKPKVGTFRNVLVSNIIAFDASNTGCSITGIPGFPIENVTLSNIKINFVGGGTREQSNQNPPEVVEKYPESTMFGVLPAYGFFCRHVKGLTFRDVNLTFVEPDYRPALICDDVRNLNLNGFNSKVLPETSAMMIFKNTKDVMISGCRPQATNVFLHLNDKCEQINILGNDFSRVKRLFRCDVSTSESEVYAINNRNK